MDRRCRACGITKPLADFERRPTKRYGRGHRCRECVARAKRERYVIDPGAHRRSTRIYDADRVRRTARFKVRDAVASGRLVKPERCQRCGVDPGRTADGRSLLHAHHPFGRYDRPLVVQWLCAQTCHPEAHREEAA